MPDYQVYVIINLDGRRYIGISENVAIRLGQHNRGESKWTAKNRPWSLEWMSEKMSLADARRLENMLKRQKGGRGFFNITGLPFVGS
ncbi:MAG TPA: GIY-YIG nuclease family protein [Candidatus Didemnitutus sp.]|nr:GIY-YIG nuclease family protein [Candidatus Didemnitutus sp.]